jgi:hypothetical protein
MNPSTQKIFISKLYFCWLSLLTGAIGGHWIYVNKKRFGYYLLSFPLSAFAGWIDTMRFGLMPDEQFNSIFNPEHPNNIKQTSGTVVLAVALSLAFSATALVACLAMIFQWYFSGMVG